MVTSRQKKEMRRRMRSVKDAINDDGKTEEDVKKEAADLYQYLYEEGFVQQDV